MQNAVSLLFARNIYKWLRNRQKIPILRMYPKIKTVILHYVKYNSGQCNGTVKCKMFTKNCRQHQIMGAKLAASVLIFASNRHLNSSTCVREFK